MIQLPDAEAQALSLCFAMYMGVCVCVREREREKWLGPQLDSHPSALRMGLSWDLGKTHRD